MDNQKFPTESPADEVDEGQQARENLGLERLVFFSDAVFAIAITLLVLEIRLPAGAENLDNSQLSLALLGLFNKYLAYLISFLVIGSFWIGHHRKFGLIEHYDRRLLMLNLLFLCVIAFIPFPSSVISVSGNRTATIFYASTMVLAGLMFMFVWQHAVNKKLIVSHLDPGRRQREFWAPIMFIGVFLLSIGIAYININLAKLIWIVFLPISLAINNR